MTGTLLRIRRPARRLQVQLRSAAGTTAITAEAATLPQTIAFIGPRGPKGDPGPAVDATDPGDLTLYFLNGLT